jgi:hypothetical protein
MGPAPFLAALAELKEPPPTGSRRVEATTKDRKRWVIGVRLETKEEGLRAASRAVRSGEAGYLPPAIMIRVTLAGKSPTVVLEYP